MQISFDNIVEDYKKQIFNIFFDKNHQFKFLNVTESKYLIDTKNLPVNVLKKTITHDVYIVYFVHATEYFSNMFFVLNEETGSVNIVVSIQVSKTWLHFSVGEEWFEIGFVKNVTALGNLSRSTNWFFGMFAKNLDECLIKLTASTLKIDYLGNNLTNVKIPIIATLWEHGGNKIVQVNDDLFQEEDTRYKKMMTFCENEIETFVNPIPLIKVLLEHFNITTEQFLSRKSNEPLS